MSQATNIVHGSARIYVAPAGTTLPVFADIADLTDGSFAGFEYAGATTGAVSLKEKPSYRKVQADQSSNADVVLVTGIETTVSAEMLEVDAALLKAVLRGTATTATGHAVLTPGTVGQAPEVSVAIVGPWLNGNQVLAVIERGAYVSDSEVKFTRSEETNVSVEILALEPATAATSVVIAYGTAA